MDEVREQLAYLDSLEMWKGAKHKGLGPVSDVAREMGNPQDKVKTIHVTGTNGKGSTSVMIASMLGQAGYTVGLFSSPHINRVNERVRIDGLPIDDAILAQSIAKVREASTICDQELSYFEVICLVAFETFSLLGVDYSVIEVGLGGKKDATNIIARPEVSVITSISLDHQHILGETRAEIAHDKAHIIKQGSQAVVGNISADALAPIIEYSDKLGVPLALHGREYTFVESEKGQFRYQDNELGPEICPQLPGIHQISNAALAIRVGKSIGLSDKDCAEGIKNAFWPARLEILQHGERRVILDCAHNEGSVSALVEFLQSQPDTKYDILFGVVGSKDWQGMVDHLKPYAASWSFLETDLNRSLPCGELIEYLSGSEVRMNDYTMDYHAAVTKEIFEYTSENDNLPLLVVGSIYMVSNIRNVLFSGSREERPVWVKK